MKKLLLIFALMLPLGATTQPLEVFVSIPPQAQLVERIGGKHVAVESLVKPGFDPHTFEPTPGQIARLARAALYVGIGLPFEPAWIERIRSANPAMRFVDLSAGISRRRLETHAGHSDSEDAEAPPGTHEANAPEAQTPHHADTELDPHVWTSPMLVKRMSQKIAEELIALAPGYEAEFTANFRRLDSDLDALDQAIRHTLADLPQRRFMVFHPAWGYFADAYGLEQIPIEKEGKEPGPRRLAALIDQARRDQIRVIFVQPELSHKAAEQVANAIGGRVEVIDSLAPDYFANMRRVAQAIAGSEPGQDH